MHGQTSQEGPISLLRKANRFLDKVDEYSPDRPNVAIAVAFIEQALDKMLGPKAEPPIGNDKNGDRE